MDVKKKLLVINQSIEELKQTEIQIWTRITSDKTRRGTETINEHIERIVERVSNLETRYNQHQKSLNEVTKLGLTLLDKASSLKDAIGMLVCNDEDIENQFSERQSTKLEENHNHFHSETENIKSEMAHVSKSTSNVTETQDTNDGGNELQILVEDCLLDKSACSHIEDVAVNKTEATTVLTKSDIHSAKNERNYAGNDQIKNHEHVLLETDLKMSSPQKDSKKSGSNEKYIDIQEVNVTESKLGDIEQKTNNHRKSCRNEFGYKFKLSNMELDNRVSFHNKLAAYSEGLAVSSSEDITIPPTPPNIKMMIPREITTKRLEKSDSRTSSLFAGLDDSTIETDTKGQPKTINDWLKFASQVNAHSSCRLRSNPPLRGSGQHAILVLDTSEYMKGHLFESMKSTALQYVEGIQQINTTMGMEDNIGLAIFGGQTCLVQESTSNYDLIKQLIAQQQPGGSAPVLAGLLMGLCGVLGGPLSTVNGCTIQGRIILFTDGTAGTELHESETGRLSVESYFIGDFRDQASTAGVIGMLTDRYIRTYYVPIGKQKHKTAIKMSNGNIMEQAVRQTNGKIVPPDEMYRLIRMTQVVLLAVKVASELRYSPEGKDRELIRRKIHQNASHMVDSHDDCLDIVVDFINPLTAKTRKGKYTELKCRTLQLGDRVRRGPDWTFHDQDSNMPGTVVGQQRDGWVLVEWDSGARNVYPYDEQADHYGLRKVNERRILVDEMVAVGCRVHRGRDWKYNDDDGGPGSLGIVLKVRQDGTIIVRWDCKTIGLYKIGCDGVFEIAICDDSSKYSSKIKQKPDPNSHTVNNTDLTDEESNEENEVQINNTDLDYVIPIYSESSVSALWEFKIDDSVWRQYPPDINEKLEKAFKRKSGKVIIEMDQSTYVVNFTKMVQEQQQNKTKIPVRRRD